jgi:hypothetical protein
MIVCTCEDRPGSIGGLKLLILSLATSSPGLPIDATVSKEAQQELEAWARRVGIGHVRFRSERSWSGAGWNVKPSKLLELLDEGHSEVVWIDTDIVTSHDIRPLLESASKESLVIAQELKSKQPVATKVRTESWGLPYARAVPNGVNSCVTRVTQTHRPLLEAWRSLLSSREYLLEQARPVTHRPIHMVGDQDVLWALLGTAEFAYVPVHSLTIGDQIIHSCGARGYTIGDRLRHVWGEGPALIHIPGRKKPWYYSKRPSLFQNINDYVNIAIMEVSPYVAEAAQYADRFEEATPWLETRTGLGRVCRAMAFGHPSLQGMPLALASEAVDKAQWAWRGLANARKSLRLLSARFSRRKVQGAVVATE